MSYISRTLGNLRKIGLKEYWHQINYIGDTKAGTLVGVDKFGNKFYENNDELPLRTRWVDYVKHDFDASHIEPMWHMWISYGVDQPPTQDPLTATNRSWASPRHIPNPTFSRGAFKTYSTTKPKISSWEPVAAPRQ
ncbi:NADH ubiquinone oxidoreductase subunit NDUFA12-domain-containing protein [Phialemonium atrogriseum]|uniref:NADH dehydrogenase [ubiquinone] 1 alpha subcomplex subunit n=1 Tax=Phialemonium atrogriseum TaxID=1093897 RepID=A0AAJ0BXF1_9PEZI|nr:NADH ubiquinone oxidoreductase subunit NDUFA12-domain-containing protein [Phialemonium atrogriseum]KAK1766268.1 NADH ubiquinone oxidoreductase subunit NDUFA12-domain-containing protein [Phialemonium atrogriseum]